MKTNFDIHSKSYKQKITNKAGKTPYSLPFEHNSQKHVNIKPNSAINVLALHSLAANKHNKSIENR